MREAKGPVREVMCMHMRVSGSELRFDEELDFWLRFVLLIHVNLQHLRRCHFDWTRRLRRSRIPAAVFLIRKVVARSGGEIRAGLTLHRAETQRTGGVVRQPDQVGAKLPIVSGQRGISTIS